MRVIRSGEELGATSMIVLATAWITPPACTAVQRKENPCSLSQNAKEGQPDAMKTSRLDYVAKLVGKVDVVEGIVRDGDLPFYQQQALAQCHQ